MDITRLQRGDDSTQALDPTQLGPRSRRELIGELLDVPRPTGRVDHPGQVALHLQDGLGVAGDAPSERGAADGDQPVVGQDRHGVGAAHARSEAGDRRAQRVHPRVVSRHHHPRGVGVMVRTACVGGEPGDLGDASPQAAGGTELGDRLELVGRGGPPELELGAGPIERHALGGQGANGVARRGDVPAELLGVGRTRLVPDRAVGDDDPRMRGRVSRVRSRATATRTQPPSRSYAPPVRAHAPIGSTPSVPRRSSGAIEAASQASASRPAALVPSSSAGVDSDTGASSRYTPVSTLANPDASTSAPSSSSTPVAPDSSSPTALEPSTVGHTRWRISHGAGATVDRADERREARYADVDRL